MLLFLFVLGCNREQIHLLHLTWINEILPGGVEAVSDTLPDDLAVCY